MRRRFNYIAVSFSPRGIGYIGNDKAQLILLIKTKITGYRIVLVAKISPVSKQKNLSFMGLARLFKNPAPHFTCERLGRVAKKIGPSELR